MTKEEQLHETCRSLIKTIDDNCSLDCRFLMLNQYFDEGCILFPNEDDRDPKQLERLNKCMEIFK